MAISIRDSAVTAVTGDPIDVNLPTLAADDILVMLVRLSTNRTITTPTDWNLELHALDADSQRAACYTKKATGSEGSTLPLNFSASAEARVVVFSVQGAEDISVNAIDDDYSAVAAGSSTATCPGVTVSDNGSLVVRAVWASYYDTIAAPTNHTLINATTGRWRVGAVYQDALQDAGSLGTQDFTGLSATGPKYTGTLVFAPSAATAPTISSVTLSGTSQIGQTLTATVVTDQDPVDSTAYQWEKASDGSGTGAADISGETSSTLALTYADFGDLLDTAAYVRCGAIATKNALPSDEAFSAWQAVTAPSGSGVVVRIDQPVFIM